MASRAINKRTGQGALSRDFPKGMSLCLWLFLLVLGLLSTTASNADEVEAAIRLLQSDQPTVRYQAARTLRKLKPETKPAIDALIAALADTGIPSEFDVQYLGPRVNDAALAALIKIGQPAVPALIAALEHQDKTIREMAARTLGELGPIAKDSFPAMSRLLKDSDKWVRYDAIFAIGQIGKEPKIVVPLLEEVYLKGEDNVDQEAALEALFSADPDGTLAIPVLLKALNNENADVLSASIVTLGKYGEKAEVVLDELIKLLQRKELRWDAYADFGFQVPVRQDAIRTLAEIGPKAKPALPELTRMMEQDKNTETRIWAAAAVLRIGADKQVSETALAMLVKAEAYEALSSVGNQDAVDALIKVLQTEDSSQWRFDRHEPAVEALGEMGPKAAKSIPILRKLLNSSDEEDYFPKRAAVVALGKIGSASAEAIPDLKRMIPSPADDIGDWNLEDDIEEAISKIQHTAPPER